MTHETSAPLTPNDCDLRDFPFMPVDIGRLFGSEFHAQSDDAAWRAGLTLWFKSYHQVPAASLPDDDVALARLAELGRDVKGWRKMKAAALRHWVKCTDGRLYHPVVAEKALEGWVQKLTQRKSSAAGNAKRYGLEFDPAPFEAKIEEALLLLAKLRPDSRIIVKRSSKSPTGTPGGSRTAPGGSQNDPDGSDKPPGGSPTSIPTGPPDRLPSGSQETGTGIIVSSSLRSEETREGASTPIDPSPRTKPRRHPFPDGAFGFWYSGYPNKVGRGAAERAFEAVRKADDVAFQALLDSRDAYIRTKPADRAWCNPATWLNQKRWLDQPASAGSAGPSSPSSDPRVDLGGGISAPHSTIRSVWSKGQWPRDWGPRPDEPGCRVPPQTMSVIMQRAAA